MWEEEEELLRRAMKEGMLNIQSLAVRSLLYSSSSLECAEGKVYNVKIHIVQTIIQDIDITRTYAIEFLFMSTQHWHARK
jgi:hypothetical protein